MEYFGGTIDLSEPIASMQRIRRDLQNLKILKYVSDVHKALLDYNGCGD